MGGNITYDPALQTPAYDFKPQGALAGMLFNEDLNRAQQMQPVTDSLQRMDAQRQAIGLQDLMSTHDLSAQATNARSQATINTAVPDAQADLSLKQDKAQLSRSTINDQISERIAQHALTMGEMGRQQLANGAADAAGFAKFAMGNDKGPQAEAAMRQFLTSKGHNPDTDPVAKYVLKDGPSGYAKNAQDVQDWYDNADSKFRQRTKEQTQKDAAAMERTKVTSQATIEAAKFRATAAIKSTAQLFDQAMATKDYRNVIMLGQALLSNPGLDDASKARVNAAMSAAQRMWSVEQAAKQQPGISNAIPSTLSQTPDVYNNAFPQDPRAPGAVGGGGGIPAGWAVKKR